MWWLQILSGFGNRVEGLEGFGIRVSEFRVQGAAGDGMWCLGSGVEAKSNELVSLNFSDDISSRVPLATMVGAHCWKG